MKERFVPPGLLFLSLDRFLPRPLHGFPIAHDSRVSHLRIRAVALFPEYVLMEPSSIAIWHRNKVAMAIAIVIWVTNTSFLTYGESPPSIPSLGILTDVV
jgi:hypothetical protein